MRLRRTGFETRAPLETLAQIQAERIRLAEWEHDQLQGQLQLAERTLTRERDEHHRALTQSLEQVLDLEEFEQQLTAFGASSARFEQQLTSNRTNDERIRQCLRVRHWTDAEIHTLMSPSSPSSSSAAPGATLHHRSVVARPSLPPTTRFRRSMPSSA